MTRLNLGSGPHYAPGWLNVDLYAEDADLQADLYELDAHLEADIYTQVYLGHVLEHLEWERIPEALEQIRQVMAPGGTLMVVGPCILRAHALRQPAHIMTAILADPRDEPTGHGHAWTPTAELTLAAVRHCFDDAREIEVSRVTKPLWPNPTTVGWQCAVTATRTA